MLGAIMRGTEVSVIKAARQWAARNNQDGAQVVIEAADAIGKIRSKFTGNQYQKALESLYESYTES